MKKIKTLVIYELIPEETIKAVVEFTEDEYSYFSKCHGCFVNAGDATEEQMDISNVINNALCTNTDYIEYADSDKEKEYFGKWTSYILKEEDVDLTGVTRLISTGFYL